MKKDFNIFVIMPFGEKFDKIYNDGIYLVNIPGHTLIIKRADMSLKGLKLVENVHKNILDADFCIADITDLNPNVLYEIGFAQAIKKEVIVIKEKKTTVPIDLSDKYFFEYDPLKLDALTQSINRAIIQAIKNYTSEEFQIKNSYQIMCYKDRNEAKIEEELKTANRNIDILQTNLSAINKVYSNSIMEAIKENDSIMVRVLTLDPESFFVAKRAEQIGIPIAHYRDELHQNINLITQKFKEFPDRFLLKTYDNFPTQITFIIDNKVYSCSMAMTFRSRDLCTFQLKKNDPGVEKSFIFHFESLWKSAAQYEFSDFIPSHVPNIQRKTIKKTTKKIIK